MEPTLTLSIVWNWINTNAAGLQAVASCLGVPAVVFSLALLIRQVDQQTVTTRATIYQNITSMMLEIDRYFVDNPNFKPYFYENAAITDKDPEYARVLTIAEMFIDFMDFVLTHKPDMPKYPWDEWAAYFKQVYDHSPALRKFYADHLDWYDDLTWVFQPSKDPGNIQGG